MAKRFLVNPLHSVTYKGKPASHAKWAASGFRRNAPKRKRAKKPTARQLAARRKFAAMARARAAAARRNSGASTTGGSMKTRRKSSRKAVRRTTGRKRSRSAARRRYAANPRHHAKRGRRRHYRRNPGMIGAITGTVVDTGVVLIAGGAGRMLAGLIPFNASTPANQPYIDFGKAALIAVGVRTLGAKFLGQDKARLAAIGVMLPATKNLVLSFAPSASTYLGAADRAPMFLPRSISARNPGMNAYPAIGNKGPYTAPQMAAYPQVREVAY